MLDLRALIAEGLSTLFNKNSKPKRVAYEETPVGAGFYSLRKTRWGSKLVKTDRSPAYRGARGVVTAPIVGKRYPEKRKGRRAISS